jgi:hypothetical protein
VSIRSDKSGTTRGRNRLSDVLRENVNARVRAGIHFGDADMQGARLGLEVAGHLARQDVQPVRRLHWRLRPRTRGQAVKRVCGAR